jgi:hypothetical protein
MRGEELSPRFDEIYSRIEGERQVPEPQAPEPAPTVVKIEPPSRLTAPLAGTGVEQAGPPPRRSASAATARVERRALVLRARSPRFQKGQSGPPQVVMPVHQEKG